MATLIVKTARGTFGISANAKGLTRVSFSVTTPSKVKENPEQRSPAAKQHAQTAAKALNAYMSVAGASCHSPIDFSTCTPFATDIYRALIGVPCGETITYGELATRAGHPGSARAVGQVLKNNPMPIFIPCHRVVASGGKLGGWSGPPGWKEQLLAWEGVSLDPA